MSAILLFQMNVFTGRENGWGWGVVINFLNKFFFSKNQTKIKQKILSNKTSLFLFLLLTESQSQIFISNIHRF